jgi:protocatechuate 3,4-dioxygenase, alpha subunit
MRSILSGSQTVGPFFRIGLEHLCAQDAPTKVDGAQTVQVRGRVFDGEGVPVPDAVLEIWHADTEGRFGRGEPAQSGRSACFTRAATDDDGSFSFVIPMPGAISCGGGEKQAPHLAVLVFARGLLRHLMTRMYFPAEPAIAADPVLQLVPEDRRRTLIAQKNPQRHGELEWDVVLQGNEETVFFAW